MSAESQEQLLSLFSSAVIESAQYELILYRDQLFGPARVIQLIDSGVGPTQIGLQIEKIETLQLHILDLAGGILDMALGIAVVRFGLQSAPATTPLTMHVNELPSLNHQAVIKHVYRQIGNGTLLTDSAWMAEYTRNKVHSSWRVRLRNSLFTLNHKYETAAFGIDWSEPAMADAKRLSDADPVALVQLAMHAFANAPEVRPTAGPARDVSGSISGPVWSGAQIDKLCDLGATFRRHLVDLAGGEE